MRTVIDHTVLGVLKQFTTLRQNIFNTSAQDLCAFDQLTVCYRCLSHLAPEHQLCAQRVCGVRWFPALKHTCNKSPMTTFTKPITNFCKKGWDDNLRCASITLRSCASPDPVHQMPSCCEFQHSFADRSQELSDNWNCRASGTLDSTAKVAHVPPQDLLYLRRW